MRRMLRPQWVFLSVSLVVMLFLAVLTPVAAGPDEPTHLYRMQQIADGHMLSQTVTESWDSLDRTIGHAASEESKGELTAQGGYVDSGFKEYVSTSYQIIRTQPNRRFAFPAWADSSLPPDSYSGRQTPAVFSNTAGNSPFLYLSQVLGYKAASLITNSVHWRVVSARVAGVFLYCFALCLAVSLTPVGKWLFAVIGLLPGPMVVNSAVTADTMTMAVCVLFTALMLRLCFLQRYPSTLELAGAGLLTVLLGFVKLTYFPLALLSCLPVILNRKLRTRRALAVLSACFVVGCACFVAWYLTVDSINSGLMFGRDTDPVRQKAFILSHPLYYCRLLVTLAARVDVLNVNSYNAVVDSRVIGHASWLAILLLILACYAAAREGARLVGKRRRHVAWTFLTLFALSFVLICTALYMYWDVPGNSLSSGVQARYFLPVLPLLLLPVALLLSDVMAQPADSLRGSQTDASTDTMTEPGPKASEENHSYGVRPRATRFAYPVLPMLAALCHLVLTAIMLSNMMNVYYGVTLLTA